MTGYIIRRTLWIIPVLWAVATITFLLMHAVPGGPFDRERELPPQVMENLNKKYNLDKPLYEQYGLYFWDLLHGDLGNSYRSVNQPVTGLIREGWMTTAQLGTVAFIYAVVFGMTLGVLAALNQNKIGDYLGVFFATAGAAMPSFIIAVFLVIIFSVKLGWFDVLGWEFGNYRKMVIPVLSLGTLPGAYIARITRASMLEVLRQDYIRTARAKGLAEYVVVLRHTIKNALVPILTVSGPLFAFLVTGSFIVERIFAIPGVGRRFVDAVFVRDYGMIMGIVLFYAAIIAVANLVVDILYAAVDPRIRYG
ncbi:MAG: ABC transporter permease [Dehalococcoidia bacterium]|nr:ABC transporter permease [Dehalococcoidia bacterium]